MTSQAAREIAEQVAKKFGKELGTDTVETISKKTLELSARHGDDAAKALLNTGPKTFRLVSEAGEHGDSVVKLLAKYGDNAVLICEKPQRLRLFAQYGDDAAEAIMRHGDNAEVLLQQYGKSAAGALAKVDGQNGRRLVTMNNDGELAKIGGADKVFDVVEKFGNRGANFIYNNKGALAISVGALAFYSHPEPFIEGIKELVVSGGEVIVRTIGEEVIQPTIREMNSIVLTMLIVGVPIVLVAFYFRKQIWKLVFPKQKVQ